MHKQGTLGVRVDAWQEKKVRKWPKQLRFGEFMDCASRRLFTATRVDGEAQLAL